MPVPTIQDRLYQRAYSTLLHCHPQPLRLHPGRNLC